MDTSFYDNFEHHLREIDHKDDAFYAAYYADNYSFYDIQEQELQQQRFEMEILRKKLMKEKSKLKKEKESLKQQREKFKNKDYGETTTKYSDDNPEDHDEDECESGTEKDDHDLCKKTPKSSIKSSKYHKKYQKYYYEADHEKCHKVNQKLRNKLKEKTKECEQLQSQIKKLRGEIRESHDHYDKYLDYERNIIKQKFDIKELKRENESIKTMYQDLLEKHQDLTNKYKEQLNQKPFFEFNDKHIFHDNDSTSSMVTTASSHDNHQDFIRSPLKNRPCPIITRSTPSSSISPNPNSYSTMPPSFGTHDIDEKLHKINGLNETIKELRQQLLRSKHRSVTREASTLYNKYSLSPDDGRSTTSKSITSSSKPQPPTAGYINLEEIAIDLVEDDDSNGAITIGRNFECNTSTGTGSTFQGVITYDNDPTLITTKGNAHDPEPASTRSQSCSDLKKVKKRGFWRGLFSLCSSPRNRDL